MKLVEFQFPSNGKVLSDSRHVSDALLEYREFQFPSNGKVLSDGFGNY